MTLMINEQDGHCATSRPSINSSYRTELLISLSLTSYKQIYTHSANNKLVTAWTWISVNVFPFDIVHVFNFNLYINAIILKLSLCL